MRRPAPAAYVLALLVVASGCAMSPDGASRQLTGTAGPIEWEITDVGRIARSDGMRLRWSYTIVLRERAGTAVQFEAIERGIHTHTVATGGFSRTAFNRRLDARSELRYSAVENWGWGSSGGPQFGSTADLGVLIVERKFIGKDAQGQTVVVPVRVEFSPGSGRRSRQPASPEPPLPPARQLPAADLASLAGRWEGYYQSGGFQLPMEAAIREDGTVEVGENDPVTNRFRGSLSIRDGRVWYAGRDSGELVLHQEGATRLLVGRITLATSGSAPPEIIPLRLEWKGSPSGAATAATSPTPPPASPAPSVPTTRPTVETAAVSTMNGTYRGTVSGDQQGRPYSARITITLAQQGDQVTGTWLTASGGSGTVTGRLVSPTRAELRIEQLHPCPAQFTGMATIGEGGSSLGGSYSGTGCAGPVSTSFTVVRQP